MNLMTASLRNLFEMSLLFYKRTSATRFTTDRVTYYVTDSNKLWIPKYGHSETTCMNLSELFPTLECIWKCIILNIKFHLIQLNSYIFIVGTNMTPGLVLLKLIKLFVGCST